LINFSGSDYNDGGDDGTGAEGRNKKKGIRGGVGTNQFSDGPQDYAIAASMNFYHQVYIA